jgi:nucleotide-binding universal stress UspA family protein
VTEWETTFELGTDGPSLILVAVDGSDTSLRAGAYAAGLARRQGARLAVIFVKTVGSLAQTVAGAVPAMDDANRSTAQELRDLVEQQKARLGLQADFYEREGNPFAELVALADELRADAVVVGASMQAGHRFIGSLALHLVRAAKWPVTVVP